LLLYSFNLKSSLAVEVVEAEVDARVEVVEVEAVPHVQVEGSPPPRLPPGQLPARPLGQVLAALRLVLVQQAQQAVLRQVPGPQAALLPRRRRKVELAPAAALRRGKVLPLHSVQAARVQMSQAAVQRLAR
jgi:hypothetical protein